MTTLLNNKGLSKSELEAIRNSIASEKESDGSTSHTMRLMSLRGKESALVHILEFMSKNMKK